MFSRKSTKLYDYNIKSKGILLSLSPSFNNKFREMNSFNKINLSEVISRIIFKLRWISVFSTLCAPSYHKSTLGTLCQYHSVLDGLALLVVPCKGRRWFCNSLAGQIRGSGNKAIKLVPLASAPHGLIWKRIKYVKKKAPYVYL